MTYLVYLACLGLVLYLLDPLDLAIARRVRVFPPLYPWIPPFFSFWPPFVGSGQALNGHYLKAGFLCSLFWSWRYFMIPLPRPFYGLEWPPILWPIITAGVVDAYLVARRRWTQAFPPADPEDQARINSFLARLAGRRPGG